MIFGGLKNLDTGYLVNPTPPIMLTGQEVTGGA